MTVGESTKTLVTSRENLNKLTEIRFNESVEEPFVKRVGGLKSLNSIYAATSSSLTISEHLNVKVEVAGYRGTMDYRSQKGAYPSKKGRGVCVFPVILRGKHGCLQ